MATSDPLAVSVQAMADDPSPEHQEEFCRALLVSQLGAKLPDTFSGTSREHTVTEEDEIAFPVTSDAEGNPMLVAYCDLQGMSQLHPQAKFFAMGGRNVLELAQQSGCGLIVNCMTTEHPCYTGIRKEEIPRILADNPE